MGKPPLAVALTWKGDRRFAATANGGAITLDGDSSAGPSPMETLAFSLAGCMAIDVVDILKKGRHHVASLEVHFSGERVDESPRQYQRITLRYVIQGDVPDAAIERSIELSRAKYCSVWHSMRQDIEFLTAYEVKP